MGKNHQIDHGNIFGEILQAKQHGIPGGDCQVTQQDTTGKILQTDHRDAFWGILPVEHHGILEEICQVT